MRDGSGYLHYMRAGGLWICAPLAALAVCVSPTVATASSGLEPGVQVDPGSPAEKEYVLPLNQARQTGSGGSKGGGSGGLFGAGVKPPSGGSGGGSAGAGATGGGGRSSSGRSSHGRVRATASAPAQVSAPLPASVLRAERSQDSSAGSGSWLALLGGGLGVLVLAAFGGTVLRHSRRPRPTS
jgi:hypothetical protein